MKVTGPMMSLTASGSFGGVLVASRWKGRPYFRVLVTPANPKSPLQISTRAMFKFLSQNWAAISAANKATWQTIADQIVASTFNAYMKENQTNWRNFVMPSQATPATRVGTVDAIDTFTAVAGVRQITLTLDSTPISADTWGYIIFRSLTTGFTPSISNVHAIILSDDGTDVTFIDTPLEADTYFYDAKPFNDFGKEGTLKGEISATVT